MTEQAKNNPAPARKGGFVKGTSGNPRGRPKGRKNKLTTMLELVQKEVSRQGEKGLRAFAKDYPRDFWALAGKLLPRVTELSGPDGGPIQTQEIVDVPPAPETYDEWLRQRMNSTLGNTGGNGNARGAVTAKVGTNGADE